MKRINLIVLVASLLGLGSLAISQVISGVTATSAAQLGMTDPRASMTLRALASGQVLAGPCLVDEMNAAGSTFSLIRPDGVNEQRTITICNLSMASIELRIPGISTPLAVIDAGRSEAVDYFGDGVSWRTLTNVPVQFAWVAR